MRQLEGRTLDVPVVTSVDPGTDGADLTVIADTTATYGHVRPRTLGLFLEISGAGSVELIVFVRISIPGIDLGWARLVDTGNLGMIYGKALPSPGSYVALVNFAGIYSEIVILAQNNVGGVSVDRATLISYDEYTRDH